MMGSQLVGRHGCHKSRYHTFSAKRVIIRDYKGTLPAKILSLHPLICMCPLSHLSNSILFMLVQPPQSNPVLHIITAAALKRADGHSMTDQVNGR